MERHGEAIREVIAQKFVEARRSGRVTATPTNALSGRGSVQSGGRHLMTDCGDQRCSVGGCDFRQNISREKNGPHVQTIACCTRSQP